MTTPISPRPHMRIRAITTGEPPSRRTGSESGDAGPSVRMVADERGQRKKRKPNSGSFPPNVSGNPRGRPKGSKGVKAIVRKELANRIVIQTERGARKVAIFEGLIKQELKLAAEGDWRARRTIFDLGKWAFGDSSERPFPGDPAPATELSETGAAIIEWFRDEINGEARRDGGKQ